MAVSYGGGGGAVGTMAAEVVMTGADGNTGGAMVVWAAVVGVTEA